ncbi:FGGY-family carbohydrate kinase [Paracoccus denitrificans]|uniref:Carbohydrate kinase, FGGY n=1 Tax=Paracoccus denitrificans (strain Pd 1222) TaxID=318586 RepID=A1B9P5_PARDP|nr:FGGY-family carbohydrate kinase [Paracoccus denitrificans]ABL72239.1 carbohydrate kinase, FGGY [Paracoccus denitrificans PD1222]MBB4625842.1 ribulose kinase [Paracoccus denitrificans]MCU7426994.1 FGGY-family carbohydrate kinase [Paracoccus denitrificans]QAR28810.1 carbohydrate kinase [Paracoccus denitrificans]UPV96959.1 FGGY-family carbohydrate kinase [Paracoccus denitrificans]
MLIGAVDVGSARARAGLFTLDGRLVARASRGFATIPGPDRQSMHDFAEIWQAVAEALAEARRQAGASPAQVGALAFDATCSLVVEAPGFAPDVIAWHDHRAIAEAGELSRIPHEIVARAGGSVSPEMQTPKLMWLARHRPEVWAVLAGVRDLCDHLAFRATGIEARSLCAAAAKWPWLPDRGGWQADLLEKLGITDFPRPGAVLPPGTRIGPLSPQGAAELGLEPEALVATGLIDAFAGALGAAPDMPALIAGTSNCVMATGLAPRPALWGPYPGAILPGESVTEGGQSATGALLERVRGLYPQPVSHDEILARIAADPEPEPDLHVLPDIKGSRTPFADPLLRGAIHGLTLERSAPALDALYWRAAVGIALGTRQVIAHMGLAPAALAMAGGQARSALLRQLYADATGAEIHWQPEDAVLRGTAIAAAAPLLGGIRPARDRFARPVEVTRPDPAARARRERDWRIFLRMQQQRAEIAAM